MKIVNSHWEPDKRIIETTLSGEVIAEEISKWRESLNDALGQIENNSDFKIFINLFGFKAQNIEAHKRFRNIIPLTLANYGFRVGNVDLFEDITLPRANIRDIKCLVAAHVYHDATKICEYERRFGKENERFFTDSEKAKKWIEDFQVNTPV